MLLKYGERLFGVLQLELYPYLPTTKTGKQVALALAFARPRIIRLNNTQKTSVEDKREAFQRLRSLHETAVQELKLT